MARTTTNYGLNISEGTDLVNPLTDIFPNFETIDTDLKDVSDSAVGSATELLTGTVHALTRADSDRDIFTFTATSNFEAGETFTLDGVQVTALTPDGQTLSTGCYIIGSEVLCAVKGTLVTFYVNPSKALDSDKLDGHDSSYFATDSDLDAVAQDVSDISTKVGTGVLQTTAQDCVGAINEVNSKLTHTSSSAVISAVGSQMNSIVHNATKFNNLCALFVNCAGTSLPHNSWVTVGTLVEGFRPSVSVSFSYADINGTTGCGRISTTGLIEVLNPNYNTSGVLSNASFNVTYETA